MTFQMKRLLPIFLLLFTGAAFAVNPIYVDTLYLGGGNNGTSTNPYQSMTAAWGAINSALASANVTVYASAADPTYTTAESEAPWTYGGRTDTSTHILTVDGTSQYQTNTNHAAAATWASTGVTLTPCTGQNCAQNQLTGILQHIITGSYPVQSANNVNACQGNLVFHGFSVPAIAGQIINLDYTHDMTIEWNNVTKIANSTNNTSLDNNGPGILVGPGQNGPCNASTSNVGGPDNVTVQYNFVHATYGECLYVGASTSDPPGGPGNAEYIANGMSCGTNCNTGANYVIKGNTFASCASWGAQGDGDDIKDGHANLQIIANTYDTSRPCSFCFASVITALSESGTLVTGTTANPPATGTNNIKIVGAPTGYNGTWSVSFSNATTFQFTAGSSGLGSCSSGTCGIVNEPGTSNPCTNTNLPGGGTIGPPGPGCDGQGIPMESGALIAGNFFQQPGHNAISITASWNNGAGRAALAVLNNGITNVNSGYGHNAGVDQQTPGGICTSSWPCWGAFTVYNNSIYSTTDPCIEIESGNTSSGGAAEATIKNNIASTCGSGGITGGALILAHDYNDCYNTTSCPSETHGITSNPQFVNTSSPYLDTNFKLQSGSAAKGAGTNLTSVTQLDTDYFGVARPSSGNWDIGFDEASSGATTAAPTFSLTAGTYSASQTNTMTSTTTGATIIYTVDGTTPATSSGTCTPTGTGTAVANGFGLTVNATETVEAIACLIPNANSSTTSAAYILQGSAPTFTPGAGTYTGSQSVTFNQAQSLNMCGTTNGATPSSDGAGNCVIGAQYAGAVGVATSETIKAIAMNAGWTDSSVASAAYVINYTVSVSLSGSGSVSSSPGGISCPSMCSAAFVSGVTVTLTASPSGGNIFTGWTGGGCSGTGTCVITVTAAQSVTATFTPTSTFTLSVNVSGNSGSGTITSSPAGINCTSAGGGGCSASFSSGATVTLSAAPASGYFLAGWDNCPGFPATCALTISGAISTGATFYQMDPSLPTTWVNPFEADGLQANRTFGSPLWSYELQLPNTWKSAVPAGCTFHTPYWTGTPTFSGLQSAVNDIEACRTSGAYGIALDIPPGNFYSTTTALGLIIPQTNSATSTNFLVLRSTQDANLPNGRVVCAHGFEDNLSTSLDIGLNNPDCTGQNMYYELGPVCTGTTPTAACSPTNVGTITGRTTLSVNTTTLAAITSTGSQCVALANGFVAAGVSLVVDAGGNQETVTTTSAANQNGACGNFTKTHTSGVPATFCANGCTYTLANGLVINTAQYNDLQYLWQVSSSGATPVAVSFCNTNAITPLVTPTCGSAIGPDHWLIEDMAASMAVGNKGLNFIVNMADHSKLASENATHIDFRKVWSHGDWTSTITGANAVSGAFNLSSCVYCSLLDSQISQIMSPARECHGITPNGTTYKIDHNWIEGCSIPMIPGGYANTAGPSIPGWVPFNDVEVRRNRLTYPFAWLGLSPITNNLNWTSGFAAFRKNGLEQKEGQRLLIAGNIIENVDNSGLQNGTIRVANVWNASGGTPGSNYQAVLTDVTETNNIYRNACNGLEVDDSSRNIGGVGLPLQRMAFNNNLMYGAGHISPGCATANDEGISLESALNQWQGTMTEVAPGQAQFSAGCSVFQGGCIGQIASIATGNTCSAPGTYALTFTGGTQIPGGQKPSASAVCTGSPTVNGDLDHLQSHALWLRLAFYVRSDGH